MGFSHWDRLICWSLLNCIVQKVHLWAVFSQKPFFLSPRVNLKDNIIFLHWFCSLFLWFYVSIFISGYYSVCILSNWWFWSFFFHHPAQKIVNKGPLGQFQQGSLEITLRIHMQNPYRLYPLFLYINDFFDTCSLYISTGHIFNFLKYLIRMKLPEFSFWKVKWPQMKFGL